MKKLGFLMLAIALMLGGTALAQNVGDNSVYFTTYYSNANTTGAPDATVRVINDGDTGGTCGRTSTCSTTAMNSLSAALASSPQTVCFRNP